MQVAVIITKQSQMLAKLSAASLLWMSIGLCKHEYKHGVKVDLCPGGGFVGNE